MIRPKVATYLMYDDEMDRYNRSIVFFIFGWKIYISIGRMNRFESDFIYKKGTWKEGK